MNLILTKTDLVNGGQFYSFYISFETISASAAFHLLTPIKNISRLMQITVFLIHGAVR